MGILNSDHLRRGRTLKSDVADALAEELTAAGAHRVLDVGCGGGAIAARLVARGFAVTGLDPSPDQVARARALLPGATIHQTGAETLPGDIGRFDAVILVNALHHIPAVHMRQALLNALSVLEPGGRLIICEPAAAGSFFRVMQPVEDETEVRHAAVSAIGALQADRIAELTDLKRWDRESSFDGLEAFISYLVKVDPARVELAERNRAALRRAWRENIELREGRAVLVQPIICWTLRPAG